MEESMHVVADTIRNKITPILDNMLWQLPKEGMQQRGRFPPNEGFFLVKDVTWNIRWLIDTHIREVLDG